MVNLRTVMGVFGMVCTRKGSWVSRFVLVGVVVWVLLGSGFAWASQPGPGGQSKLHPAVFERLAEDAGPIKAWVFFTDKGVTSREAYAEALAEVEANYNPRAIQRRQLRGEASRGGSLFDMHDLPVTPAYVEAVAATGAQVHVTSRWVNAVSVRADRAQLEALAELDCVRQVQPVARTRRVDAMNVTEVEAHAAGLGGDRGLDYGLSEIQLTQMNLLALHQAGYTGRGVIVGILDTGFQRSHEAFNHTLHPLSVLAEYDFVDDDPNTAIEAGDPSDQHRHGTLILGCLGAFMPGELVGGAYDASFVLAKTEDTTGEYPAEEDNYVAGLEFLEGQGVDMSTSSLGYIDWYTQADLDGQTAVTTIAINLYTAQGIHHCNAAGNEYHDSNPSTSSLIAPSDGFDVITCGAVDSSGTIASFSSDGPTADGRVKPEVLARGISTHTVSPYYDTDYTTADGTSLSTPLVACAVACLVDARPHWTVAKMRERLFETSDYFVAHGTFDPLYVRGYGIVDAFAAYDTCSEAGVVELDRGAYACQSIINVMVNDCGLNTDDGVVETALVDIDSDSETGVEQVTLTETAADSAEFAGVMLASTINAPGVLWVAQGDTITVTYLDADDGAGGFNVEVTATAEVDCTPPEINAVVIADLGPRSARVEFDTDEAARGTVHYGVSCGSLVQSATEAGFTTSHVVNLTGLDDAQTYFFAVEAADEAGNGATDDNGGSCYTFTTPDIPEFFTEAFDSDNDLDNLTLLFEPDGSGDFYRGCAEGNSALPTDPSGGSSLSFSPSSDDGYAQVNLTGGATVSLYGTTYSSFYVGTNGYVTFESGDTTYDDYTTVHFDQPRVSALFDDLNPSSGGSVTYKQLAEHVAVTWQNVPEWSTGGSNTFQIELFFDGRIHISYRALSAADGTVGLSTGGGQDPDFYETDLSEMNDCGAPPLHIVSSDPPDGAVDARKPHDADGSGAYGWDELSVKFDGDVADLAPADFAVSELGGDGVAPEVTAVAQTHVDTVRVEFSAPFEPVTWTTLTHLESAMSVTLGFLPADADGSGAANAGDITEVVDLVNEGLGGGSPPLWQSDIDRSGALTANDVVELIDLLNGAGEYDAYFDVALP